ncbi:response regulator transcription factor [Marinoscillum furvescens]|uniref:LytTR family two component transcriptional regulator n=1 Tax=Marinoscillum furvescens DSM 4134 TaxID=1122208 RepID=A0A3D9KYP6_MARFU|nr:response regulator [Marinoscillum furvescens]RED92461.1 LytTR family two component transcriptional regulator [Marinoscillum furvescens DSM 4134]
MEVPKIVVVEDQLVLGYDIIDRLKMFGYSDILGPFTSGEEAWGEVKGDLPDIAVMDINLAGKLTGIDLAARLQAHGEVKVIYLTSREDDQTLHEITKTKPIAFLNKPFTNNELKMAIFNAVNSGSMGSYGPSTETLNDRIFVKNGRGRYSIQLDDILWIKSNGGDTAVIMTKDRLNADPRLLPTIALNLSKIEERLSFYPNLCRASRYYIINTMHVERVLDLQDVSGGSFKKAVLIADEEITLGSRYRKSITDKFHQI